MFFEKLRKRRADNREMAREAISWTHGLTAETFSERGLLAVDCGGPRFDPTDFAGLESIDELDAQINDLFGDDDATPLTPDEK